MSTEPEWKEFSYENIPNGNRYWYVPKFDKVFGPMEYACPALGRKGHIVLEAPGERMIVDTNGLYHT